MTYGDGALVWCFFSPFGRLFLSNGFPCFSSGRLPGLIVAFASYSRMRPHSSGGMFITGVFPLAVD